MRVMKARKRLMHNVLVTEVTLIFFSLGFECSTGGGSFIMLGF